MPLSPKKHNLGVHALVQLRNTDTFLCMKRSDYKSYMAGHRDLPSGSLEKGEQAIPSLIRELEEEAGTILSPIEVKSLQILGVHSVWQDDEQTKRGTAIIYHVIVDSPDITLSHEHTEYKRLDKDSIIKLGPRREIIDKAIILFKEN